MEIAKIGIRLAFGLDGIPPIGQAFYQALESGIGNENLAGPGQTTKLGGKIDRLADGRVVSGF